MLGASSIKEQQKSISAQHHNQACVEGEHVCMALPSNSAGVEHLFPLLTFPSMWRDTY